MVFSQKNNAIARLNLETNQVSTVFPLGNRSWTDYYLDPSDNDGRKACAVVVVVFVDNLSCWHLIFVTVIINIIVVIKLLLLLLLILLMLLLFFFFVVVRPHMTYKVDWALKANYLFI